MKEFLKLNPDRKDVKLVMIGSKRLNKSIDDDVLSSVEKEIEKLGLKVLIDCLYCRM